ncbi:hypothetical protein ACH4E7_06900 [Kitasatospora sp. NPDC018058]|uniref:hypothetical protein n=1 Tax=Kitasatospora sp. NPDC018058 TaxID=3364025 RepID=UPI0037C0F24F
MSRYLEGVSLAAFARGNRRMLAPLKAHAADKRKGHGEALAAWKERRAKALEIKDPEQRAKALDDLRGERPTSPLLVAAGCTVVAAVIVWPMLHGHHAALLAGAVTLWVLAALIVGQTGGDTPAKATTATSAEEASSPPDDDGEWIQESPAPEVLWALIRHTAGLTKQGTAAHLQAILDEGQKRGEFDGWDVTELGGELEALGVRVIEKKKLTLGGKDHTRKAVLLSDLPEADPATVPAIVQGAPSATAKSAA